MNEMQALKEIGSLTEHVKGSIGVQADGFRCDSALYSVGAYAAQRFAELKAARVSDFGPYVRQIADEFLAQHKEVCNG